MGELGVPEEHIITTHETMPRDLSRIEAPQLVYNQTDPYILRDGVSSVLVWERPGDEYEVFYWGYAEGAFRVTLEGARTIGERAPTGDELIPRWVVRAGTVDPDDLPAWLPADVVLNPRVDCTECGTAVSARDIVTPGAGQTGDPDRRLCQGCCDGYRDAGRWGDY